MLVVTSTLGPSTNCSRAPRPRQSLYIWTRLQHTSLSQVSVTLLWLAMDCSQFTVCVQCVVNCFWSERVNQPPTCTESRNDPTGTIKWMVRPGGHCFKRKPDHPNVTVIAGYSLTDILTTAIICIVAGVALCWIYFKIRAYATRQILNFHEAERAPSPPPSPPPRPHTYAARWVRNQAKDRIRQIAQLMNRRPQSIESLVEEVDEEEGRPPPEDNVVVRREPNRLFINNDVALQVGDDDDDDDHVEFRIVPPTHQVRPPAALRRIMRASPQEILERRTRRGRRRNIYARD